MTGSVGILVHGTAAPASLAPTAKAIEDLGFDEIWLSEDYFLLAGISSAAITLAATDNIKVGIGILSAVVRHPAVTAMEAATLAGAFPGRLQVGIGHGVPFWVKQMDMYPKSPVASLRQVIGTVKRLLDGEELTETGPFGFDAVKLEHPAATPVPVLAGVVGPKSLQLAGEVADGTVMSVIATPEYLRYAKEQIAIGAAKAGREAEPHSLPTFVLYHLSDDSAAAEKAAREAVAFYLAAVGPTPMTGVLGFNDQLAELMALGDLAKMTERLPSEWVDLFAIHGPADRCAARIKEFHEAGADTVVLAPYPAEAGDAMIAQTAAEVLPLLRG
ncbi:LLM class flavin-dependent oxidoreductase [Nakamurella sp. YIM 132087]|uniref:LLM class flavin-dependent oxidoreductase n=1 Tax=Nakamurella alba TaxID=2665158 RepID=A0A7K1FFA3_9ACTN|nr:LLM class flavin-dependent oxidoreductase [Nakamurella alba]MTD12778.1 LLM class flavin-dependent oxidoreductase [Nakamurella alba]